MSKRLKTLAMMFTGAFVTVVVSIQAIAGAINLDSSGVAIMGYDPVAYFSESGPAMGSGQYTATHDGAVYRFSSAENQASFEADPAKYVPAYGGYCAYGMAQGYKAPIDPQAFTVVDDRLYLNYSTGVRDTWQSDIPGYIAKADENWIELGGD